MKLISIQVTVTRCLNTGTLEVSELVEVVSVIYFDQLYTLRLIRRRVISGTERASWCSV